MKREEKKRRSKDRDEQTKEERHIETGEKKGVIEKKITKDNPKKCLEQNSWKRRKTACR